MSRFINHSQVKDVQSKMKSFEATLAHRQRDKIIRWHYKQAIDANNLQTDEIAIVIDYKQNIVIGYSRGEVSSNFACAQSTHYTRVFCLY